MSTDPNKKTSRTFQCRESLWQKFEQMAKELECSVDYLINDAMKQYARQRGYVGGAARATDSIAPAALHSGSEESSVASPVSTAGRASPTAQDDESRAPKPAPKSAGSGARPLSSLTESAPHERPGPGPSLGPVSHTAVTRLLPQPPAVPAPQQKRPVAPPALPLPPPLPTASAALPTRLPVPAPVGAAQVSPAKPALPNAPGRGPRQLIIRYQGQPFTVNKDKFVIGRGKQTSDLTIKDPNVSRQHAMIEFENGQYSIVDMGSTNGVEFQGQRVQRKVIADGDTVRICDHELSFMFR